MKTNIFEGNTTLLTYKDGAGLVTKLANECNARTMFVVPDTDMAEEIKRFPICVGLYGLQEQNVLVHGDPTSAVGYVVKNITSATTVVMVGYGSEDLKSFDWNVQYSKLMKNSGMNWIVCMQVPKDADLAERPCLINFDHYMSYDGSSIAEV